MLQPGRQNPDLDGAGDRLPARRRKQRRHAESLRERFVRRIFPSILLREKGRHAFQDRPPAFDHRIEAVRPERHQADENTANQGKTARPIKQRLRSCRRSARDPVRAYSRIGGEYSGILRCPGRVVPSYALVWPRRSARLLTIFQWNRVLNNRFGLPKRGREPRRRSHPRSRPVRQTDRPLRSAQTGTSRKPDLSAEKRTHERHASRSGQRPVSATGPYIPETRSISASHSCTRL